jgi:N-methylhydantoinase A
MQFACEYDARYRGQSFELSVLHNDDAAALAAQFHQAHLRRYGYAVAEEPVEIVNARLTAIGALPPLPPNKAGGQAAPQPPTRRSVWIDVSFVETPVWERASLLENRRIDGPALIEQYDCCTYVQPGWTSACKGEMLFLEQP